MDILQKLNDFIEKQDAPKPPPVPSAFKKPRVKLLGQDSNIFNLTGIASRALKQAGYRDKAAEMAKKVFASGSFDEALGHITSYVDPY